MRTLFTDDNTASSSEPPSEEKTAAPSTELIVVEALVPAVVFAPGGVRTLLDKLKADVRAVPTDISTPKGRAAVKSLAFKVARSKTAIDELGKQLVVDLKAQTNAIDAERRIVREECDALKEEVLFNLTQWEDSEKERIAAHEHGLVAISDLAEPRIPDSAEEIRRRIDQLDMIAADGRNWQEFAQRAAQAIKSARTELGDLLEDAEAREAEEVERQRIAAEEEAARQAELARQQAEREAEIARQAAETARLEAEEEAARQAEIARQAAEAEAARVAEVARLERERIERAAQEAAEAARLEAIRRAEEAAAERKRIEDGRAADAAIARETQARLEAEQQRLIDEAAAKERQRIADAEAAEARELAAARRAEEEKAAAVEAERLRQQNLAAEAERVGRELAKKREADTANKRKVNGEAKDDLLAVGIDDKTATAVVIALAKGQIRHCKIEY